MTVRLSVESAEALRNVQDLETWGVAPTMVRGSRRAANGEAPTVAASRTRKAPAAKRHDFKGNIQKGKVIKSQKAKGKVASAGVGIDVGEAGPKDFGRNPSGRALIQTYMKQLYFLDGAVFKDKPLWTTDGYLRMKYAPASTTQWNELLEAAPACLEVKHLGLCCFHSFSWRILSHDWVNTAPRYKNLRQAISYGEAVLKLLKHIQKELESSTPSRQAFLRLLRDLVDYVVCCRRKPESEVQPNAEEWVRTGLERFWQQ